MEKILQSLKTILSLKVLNSLNGQGVHLPSSCSRQGFYMRRQGHDRSQNTLLMCMRKEEISSQLLPQIQQVFKFIQDSVTFLVNPRSMGFHLLGLRLICLRRRLKLHRFSYQLSSPLLNSVIQLLKQSLLSSELICLGGYYHLVIFGSKLQHCRGPNF